MALRLPYPSATPAVTALVFLAHLLAMVPAGGAAETVDFLREVRPILATHCFKCHGPDENARKSGLRLDVRDAALKPAKSGASAIVPGQPAASELVKRVLASDEDEVMPPPATKLPLSAAQKATLQRWIAEGAGYRPHWAFVPPRYPAIPAPVAGRPIRANPIDAFIDARLALEGLEPQPEADRATLVRRVSLDLIGLPPTPEEADAFARDPSPDAYERLVDRLLASPHYGERWARRWMDLARYADTNGYEKDRPRSMWPWRDWLIRALNDDLPFDRFTLEQIAGDLLPDATPAQRTATGFHRNTMLNEEGGIDPLEFRFHSMVDRVHVTATTWLGMTFACAQCHNHKYDPVSQREYYQFMAYLDNADEPTMDIPDPEIDRQRRTLEERIAAETADLPNRFPPSDTVDVFVPIASSVATTSGSTANRLPDGSYRFEGVVPDKDTYTFVFETSRTNIVLFQLDALADDTLPKKGPGRAPNGNFVLGELQLVAAPADSAAEPTPVPIASATADFAQNGFPTEHAFDGKPETGWAIAGEENWNRDRRATFRLAQPAGYAGGTRFTVRLVQEYGGQHVLGRVRIALGADKPDPRPLPERRQAQLAARFQSWQEREAARVRAWTPLRPAGASSKVPVLTVESDATVFVSSDQTKSDTYDLRFHSELRNLTALRLEVLPDERLPRGGPGRVAYEGPIGDFFLSTFAASAGEKPVKLVRASHTFAAGGNTAEKAIDDDPQSGWTIDGGQGRAHSAVFNFAQPLADATDLRVTLLCERYYAAGIGRFRISATTDPRGAEAFALPDSLQAALARPPEARPETERDGLLRYFVSVAPELAGERDAIEKRRRSMPALPTTLVLHERPPENPRTTYVRHRGEFLQPTIAVAPALPAMFSDLVNRQPGNRLEFARWLVSRDNPLAARVVMNRHWAAFFGRGLVRTTEDFGFQGELPTHPELLDWLAVEFMERGWSQKQMHRLIVTSATYRRASRVTPALLDKDPQNRWLARAPRFRLEAELVRDLALSASGLLSPRLGGPSVFPPQLASITREGTYGPLEWKVSEGPDRYRRGLYTFAKRTAPYATFTTFDAPSGEACTARRDVSNTPLQSLTLLNDEVFFEAAKALGRRATALDAPAEERARFLFRCCLTRAPEAEELERILDFFRTQQGRLAADRAASEALAGKVGEGLAAERAAWTAVARALLNLDETVTRG